MAWPPRVGDHVGSRIAVRVVHGQPPAVHVAWHRRRLHVRVREKIPRPHPHLAAQAEDRRLVRGKCRGECGYSCNRRDWQPHLLRVPQLGIPQQRLAGIRNLGRAGYQECRRCRRRLGVYSDYVDAVAHASRRRLAIRSRTDQPRIRRRGRGRLEPQRRLRDGAVHGRGEPADNGTAGILSRICSQDGSGIVAAHDGARAPISWPTTSAAAVSRQPGRSLVTYGRSRLKNRSLARKAVCELTSPFQSK